MEDKSPLNPGGEEFRIPDNDSEDLEESKTVDKKKKKSKLSELWAKLFNKEVEDKDEGEKSLLQSIGALFGKATGLEKEEIPDEDNKDEAEQVADTIHTNQEFAVPLFRGGVEYASLDEKPQDEQQTEVDILPITNTDSEYVIPLATAMSSDSEPEELPAPPIHEEMQQIDGLKPPLEQKTTPVEDIVTTHEGEPEETDLTSPEELARIRQEIANERGYEERQTEPVIKERETVIENRGSGGAAMLGFVAAEMLSRSRDRKIRKEAEKLRQKVDSVEKKQQVDTFERIEADARNQQQLAELRSKRQPTSEQAARTPRGNMEIEEPERLEKAMVGHKSTPQQVARPTEAYRSTIETVPAHKNTETEVVFEQVRQAADQDIALEKYYEQRHELKDDPGGTIAHSGGVTPKDQPNAHNETAPTSHNQKQVDYSLHIAEQSRKAQQTKDLYKDAIKQGAIAGIIMLVSFAVVALLWSLL